MQVFPPGGWNTADYPDIVAWLEGIREFPSNTPVTATRTKIRTLSNYIARLHEIPEPDDEWIDPEDASPAPEPPMPSSSITVKRSNVVGTQQDAGEDELVDNDPKVCDCANAIECLLIKTH